MCTKYLFIAVALCAGAAAAQDDMEDIPPAEPLPAAEDDVDVDVDPELDDAAMPAATSDDVDVDVNVDTTAEPLAPATELQAAPAAPDTDLLPLDEASIERIGAEFKVGAGGGDYTQSGVRDLTSAGPTWDVRAVFGGNFPVGVEGAYVGSSRNVSNEFANGTGDTQLVSNGVEGDLRLAVPISTGGLVDIRPFAFGGVGWQYMTMWGDGAVDEDNDDGDHIMTIPAGIGLDMGIGALNLDLRGTYRHAIGSDLFGDAGSGWDEPNALHSYNFGGAIGVEF